MIFECHSIVLTRAKKKKCTRNRRIYLYCILTRVKKKKNTYERTLRVRHCLIVVFFFFFFKQTAIEHLKLFLRSRLLHMSVVQPISENIYLSENATHRTVRQSFYLFFSIIQYSHLFLHGKRTKNIYT